MREVVIVSAARTPVGSFGGARILTTLLYAMEERDAKKGLATLCIGGGMGTSVLVERA